MRVTSRCAEYWERRGRKTDKKNCGNGENYLPKERKESYWKKKTAMIGRNSLHRQRQCMRKKSRREMMMKRRLLLEFNFYCCCTFCLLFRTQYNFITNFSGYLQYLLRFDTIFTIFFSPLLSYPQNTLSFTWCRRIWLSLFLVLNLTQNSLITMPGNNTIMNSSIWYTCKWDMLIDLSR